MLSSLIPRVCFDEILPGAANELLLKWGHRIGALNRPFPSKFFALIGDCGPVCVVAHSCLVRPHVGGGLSQLTRENTIELARLCAVRPGLCRLGIRLWREFVFPALPYAYAITYQDADLHTGNTYRFDGWQRAAYTVSGNDARSGVRGRKKYVWVWPHLKTVCSSATEYGPQKVAA